MQGTPLSLLHINIRFENKTCRLTHLGPLIRILEGYVHRAAVFVAHVDARDNIHRRAGVVDQVVQMGPIPDRNREFAETHQISEHVVETVKKPPEINQR